MIKINYEYPYYADMIRPKGFLGVDRRYHACWTYYTLAQKVKETVGESTEDQILYEGEEWMDKPYAEIAKSTATRYGLESPDEFLKQNIIQSIRLEAARQQLPRPHDEYMIVWPGKKIIV